MEAALFAKMLSDPSILDLKKLGYKYPQADMQEFVSLLKAGFYRELPLRDFDGKPMVWLESVAQVSLSAVRVLMTPHQGTRLYSAKAMEEEILATFQIEQINTTRESVRRILAGSAPVNESEQRVYGMKKGLDFIADPAHRITEETSFNYTRWRWAISSRKRTVCRQGNIIGRTQCILLAVTRAYRPSMAEAPRVYGGADRLCRAGHRPQRPAESRYAAF